jgi:hypothetical protein
VGVAEDDIKARSPAANSIWKGWLREKLISLPDQKRQVLTIRNPLSPTSASQGMAIHQACTGYAVAEMHGRGQHPRRRRNRHAHKVLAPRPSRIARLRIVADVEPRQPRNSADQKQKTDEGAGLLQVLVQLRIDGIGQKMKSPDERQQAGRHAKGDGVGQRIQLLAELAVVLVMRAMRPSSASNGMAKRMAMAAQSRCVCASPRRR